MDEHEKAGSDRAVDLLAKNKRLRVDIEKLKGKLRGHTKPGHGPCCTCQRCGRHYDDCRCDLDDVADENEELQAEVEKLKSSRICLWCKKEQFACSAGELTDHLLTCKDHPLARIIEKKVTELEKLTDFAKWLLKHIRDTDNDGFIITNTDVLTIKKNAEQALNPEKVEK